MSNDGSDCEPATRYAQITVMLSDQPQMYGAEALFNQAVTNALVAIGLHADLSGLADKIAGGGRIPSARALLTCLQDCEALDRQTAQRLDTAIKETDPARHGHTRTRHLEPSEIDALCKLDRHPALRVVDDVVRDDDWVRDRGADLMEQARAAANVQMIEEEFGYGEIERRLALVPGFLGAPGDPDVGPPQSCPVCMHDALIPDGGADECGYNVAAGTCFICSYHRSASAASHEGWLLEMHRLISKD